METKKNKLVISEKKESSVMDIFRMVFRQNFYCEPKEQGKSFLEIFMQPE